MLLLAACCCAMPVACRADGREMLCSDGYGSFSSKFATGVTVSVEPVRKTVFASRVCSASLNWKGGELAITPKASEVDVDILGADLGLGSPVVALEIRNVGSDKLVQYEIYSLKKPAQKLRTLTGGDYFNAADTDLDGRIEIWTDDAAAIDGFENLPLSAFDAAPTVVLRFEKNRLLDVSAEFQPEYDRQIAALKAEMDPQQVSRFKSSDGKMADRYALPVDQMHDLRNTKIKVLEIVWAYLYSGREQEAWSTLTAMWPAADLDRIRASIQKARTGGMRSKLDGVTERPSGFRARKHAMVFDAELQYDKDDPMKQFQADEIPHEILLRRPPLPQTAQASLKTEVVFNLVIDSAGKVRSAKPDGSADKDLIAATADWKFIPAFKNGHAVASRMRYGVTPYQ
jgi:hypothetical protein